jgi:hypothetical protein
MERAGIELTCVSCEKSEAEAPILRLRFAGEDAAICSSCLPILIHKPDRLTGRLKGAERISPSSHAHG